MKFKFSKNNTTTQMREREIFAKEIESAEIRNDIDNDEG